MTLNTDLSLVLDSLPQAVFVVGPDFGISYANAAAETIFHGSSHQLRKQTLKQILPNDSLICGMITTVFSKQAPVNAYDIDISTPKTGGGVIIDFYSALLDNDDKKALVVFREKSVAHRIARQLSHRTVARSVTGMAEMLSHEIKNPLSGIRGAAQLLESALNDEDKELATLIRTETDRVVKILDRIEVFSDETPVDVEPVNMHSVMGQVRKIAQSGFANGVEFIENYDPSLPPVSGSREELVQVFINLVKNAAEALTDKLSPQIRLTSAYRPGIRVLSPGKNEHAELPLEFTVSDNAGGISDDIRADIFEPFVTTRMNGTGMGLAFVAKTVGRHGGVIECNNTGDGTIFRLLLPAWSEHGRSTAEATDV